MNDFEITLNNPLTKEDWDKIADAEMEKTPSVTFHTPSGKEVEFVKVVHCEDCKHAHLTYDGDCKYCQLDIDRGFTEATYRNGDWFCADGERMKNDADRI